MPTARERLIPASKYGKFKRGMSALQRRFRARARKSAPRYSTYTRFVGPVYRPIKRAPTFNLKTETKFLPLLKRDERTPLAIQGLAKVYYAGLVLGHVSPTNWDETTYLEGTRIGTGTASNARIGNKVWLDKTVLNFNIDMLIMPNNAGVAYPVLEFRTIVFKPKYNFDIKEIGNPYDSLFLDESGQQYGSAVGGINGTDIMMQPLNRRQFYVLKDMKYKLSSPSIAQGGGDNAHYSSGWSSKYPCMKNIRIVLPHRKTVEYSNIAPYNPIDYDPRWAVITYARSLNKDTNAVNWMWNSRGTTMFRDP